jgi:Cdc6-like AAA superfamily ATPase
MVGRDVVLQSVRAMVLDLVKGGRSSMLMVEGPPGAGKTCLLTHLIRDEEYDSHLGGLHIFQASGNPAFKSIPLYPWRSILTVCCPPA